MTSPTERRFAAVPLAAASARLPGCEFRVLLAVCASADRNGRAWPGVTEISRRTGIARGKVPGIVKRLEVAALLRVDRQPGRVAVYHVNYGAVPSPEVSPATGTPLQGDSPPPGVSPATAQGVPLQGGEVSPAAGTKQTKSRPREQKEEHTPSPSLGERDASRPALRIVASEGERLTTEPAAELILTPESEPAETAPRAAKGGKPHPAELARAFAEFWPIYPRRVAKGAGERAYAKALKGGASPAEILLGVRRFAEKVARDGTEAQFTPHAATWLNAKRWEDEPETAAPKFKNGFMAALHEAAGGADFSELRDEDNASGAPPHAGATLDLEAETTTDSGRAA